MRGIFSRGLRLQLVAGLGMALAIPALSGIAHASSLATQTSLTAETRDQNGHTRTSVAIAVAAADGTAARGSVALFDNGVEIAGISLDKAGKATADLELSGGAHDLTARYVGVNGLKASTSSVASVHTLSAGTFSYTVAVSPSTLTLTAGTSGLVTVTVTPANASALTAPRIIQLSCAGLPDQSTSSFTPTTLEVQTSTTGALTSTLLISTQAASGKAMNSQPGGTIAWALLLPGVLTLGGLAFGLRGHRTLQRYSLLALVAVVTLLGTTACNPRYNYLNHGPTPNLPTPAGTYTLSVDALSSDGVTASLVQSSMSLTVK